MTTTPTEVRIVRTYAASPERVYRAWLEPALMRRWFAPGEFTVTAVEVDEQVGGHYSISHVDAAGQDVGGFECELLELVPSERIVLRWGFVGPDHLADPAQDSLLTIELRPTADGTELTLSHARLNGVRAAHPEIAESIQEGWAQALTKLGGVI